jgi:hypothetical protein
MSFDNYDCGPVRQYLLHIYQKGDDIDPATRQALDELY